MDELADAIRRLIPPELLPDGDTEPLFRMYALLALAKGNQVVLEDVHDAWVAWMIGINPAHPSIKPLHELDEQVQRSDQPYLDAIRSVASDRKLGR